MPRSRLSAAAPLVLVSGLGAIFNSSHLMADPVTVDLFTTVRYSDNMRQADDDEAESDFEYRPGVRIAHVKDPGQCNSALQSEFAYLIYKNETLDNQVSAQLDWDGDCEIAPYLSWRASDSLREASQSNRGTNTAANRERRNVFSTGPQLVLPLTELTSFISSLDWRKTTYEETESSDNERWVADARLQRSFSPVMQGWLSATYSDAEYDSGETLEETSYRVGMSRRISRTFLSGNIGVTSLERDVNGRISEEEGTVWSAQATHQLDNGSVFASVSHDITDQASDVEIAFGDIRFTFDQSQAVEMTSFTVGGNTLLRNDYAVNADVYYKEHLYVGSDEMEEIVGTQIGLSKALNSTLSARGRLRYERQEFFPDEATANEYAALLGLSYTRTSRLSFGLDVGHETQSASSGNAAEYSENFIAATVNYNLR